MELNQLYFYTSTIIKWKHLLLHDKYKAIIISSLKYLVDNGKIHVYSFVIMPNHIHLIWELLALNGKELPHASFMKYTSHEFLKDLKQNHPKELKQYQVEEKTREHRFWQRDPLAVHVFSPKVIFQKLNYIHHNPLQEKWRLIKEPCDYNFSSASFYETGVDKFGMLTHIGDRM